MLLWNSAFCYADFRLPKGAEVKTVTKKTVKTVKGYASGQPEKGYNLKKGDMLYYKSSGGSNYNVNASFSYPICPGFTVSVTASIPIGEKGTSVDTGVRIPKNGRYKLYVTKEVKLISTASFYRENKNSDWKPLPNGTSKKTKVIEITPVAKRQ